MQDGFGAGDVGKEATNAVAVDADGGLFGADDVGQAQSVGFEEGFAQEGHGDLKADVFEIGGGGEASLAELVDVKGELGLDVGVGVLSVVDGGAILLFELGEFDGDGLVDGEAVAEAVSDVVGERAYGEGKLVKRLGVVEQREDKVAGADVVGEVGEEGVAEGIVAEVLNGAAAVGVGVSFQELRVSERRIVLEENRANGRFPGDVDELLMGLDGVGDGRGRCEKECEGRYRFE